MDEIDQKLLGCFIVAAIMFNSPYIPVVILGGAIFAAALISVPFTFLI